MTMTITNFISTYFIPTHLREHVKEYHKAKLLVFIHTLLFTVSILSFLANSTFNVGATFPYIPTLISLGVSMFIFKKLGNFSISGNLLATVCFLILGRQSLSTGGIYSMDYVFMLIIPLVAYILANKRSGIGWSFILMSYSIILFILEKKQFFLLPEHQNLTTYRELVSDDPIQYFVIS